MHIVRLVRLVRPRVVAVTQRDCSEDCHKVLLCPACVQLDESGDGWVMDRIPTNVRCW